MKNTVKPVSETIKSLIFILLIIGELFIFICSLIFIIVAVSEKFEWWIVLIALFSIIFSFLVMYAGYYLLYGISNVIFDAELRLEDKGYLESDEDEDEDYDGDETDYENEYPEDGYGKNADDKPDAENGNQNNGYVGNKYWLYVKCWGGYPVK